MDIVQPNSIQSQFSKTTNFKEFWWCWLEHTCFEDSTNKNQWKVKNEVNKKDKILEIFISELVTSRFLLFDNLTVFFDKCIKIFIDVWINQIVCSMMCQCVWIYKEIYWVIYCYIILIYLLTSKIKLSESRIVAFETFTNLNKFTLIIIHKSSLFSWQQNLHRCVVVSWKHKTNSHTFVKMIKEKKFSAQITINYYWKHYFFWSFLTTAAFGEHQNISPFLDKTLIMATTFNFLSCQQMDSLWISGVTVSTSF
jgi:hypothetical protein